MTIAVQILGLKGLHALFYQSIKNRSTLTHVRFRPGVCLYGSGILFFSIGNKFKLRKMNHIWNNNKNTIFCSGHCLATSTRCILQESLLWPLVSTRGKINGNQYFPLAISCTVGMSWISLSQSLEIAWVSPILISKNYFAWKKTKQTGWSSLEVPKETL